VNVDTRNGVVTIKGTVPTEAAKRAAETLASETDGVVRVVNQLRVDPKTA
jgi:osmotically-inducible protein OsmY